MFRQLKISVYGFMLWVELPDDMTPERRQELVERMNTVLEDVITSHLHGNYSFAEKMMIVPVEEEEMTEEDNDEGQGAGQDVSTPVQ